RAPCGPARQRRLLRREWRVPHLCLRWPDVPLAHCCRERRDAKCRRLYLPRPDPVPRIISLIASATEIVDALGEIDNLVGRSHECDYPERVQSLPVCTRPRIAIDTDSREID